MHLDKINLGGVLIGTGLAATGSMTLKKYRDMGEIALGRVILPALKFVLRQICGRLTDRVLPRSAT